MKLSRSIVVFPFAKMDTQPLIDGANDVYDGLAADTATYNNCNPALPVFRTHIDDFVKANNATRTNKGAVPDREAKRETLWGTLVSEKGCVQILCDASPEKAASLAAGAGMRLAEHNPRVAQILVATLTTTKGTARLRASLKLLRAMLPPVKGQGGKHTINWRYTLNGTTYTNADSTPFVTTEIAGLPLNTDVGFQVSLKDRRGTTDWSQTFWLHVH